MIIDFRAEAAKRRDRLGKVHAGRPGQQSEERFARRPASTTVDCGSGWYHSEAIRLATQIQSHRDWS